MEFALSPLVREGVGESRAGPATCFVSVEVVMSCLDGVVCGPEKLVDVGDLGAPKADMNESTMQGISTHVECLGVTWPTSRPSHVGD